MPYDYRVYDILSQNDHVCLQMSMPLKKYDQTVAESCPCFLITLLFCLQISRFTEIILEKDTEEVYEFFRDDEDPARPTLLHLAASQNFAHVATHLVKKFPSLLYQETKIVGDQRKYLPVEMALMANRDETAALLISQMKPDWCVYKTDGVFCRVHFIIGKPPFFC